MADDYDEIKGRQTELENSFYSGETLELHAGMSPAETRAAALHEAVTFWSGMVTRDVGFKTVDDQIVASTLETAKMFERFIVGKDSVEEIIKTRGE